MTRCRRCAPVPEEVRRAAGLLEGRWTVSILWASIDGATRFNEFRQAVGRDPAAHARPAARRARGGRESSSARSSTRDRPASSTGSPTRAGACGRCSTRSPPTPRTSAAAGDALARTSMARASAARPSLRTGSPCETSTRSTGSASSARSSSTRSANGPPLSSHDAGHTRRPPAPSPSRVSPGTSARAASSHHTTSSAVGTWIAATPVGTSPSPPRRADRPRVVAGGDHGRAAHVPRARRQRHDGPAQSLDVAVERTEEALRLVVGHERVDEHDRVGRLVVDAAHDRAPVGVRRPGGMAAVQRQSPSSIRSTSIATRR